MMKKTTILLLLVGMTVSAQVKGNKTIETRSFNITNIVHVKINLYAKVTIYASLKEGMTITSDSNLFDLIDKEVVDNTLHLNQKKWIQASQDIIITIGAPNLTRLTTGTHDITEVISFSKQQLHVTAPIGNIRLQGKTQELRLTMKQSNVDASQLIAENAYIQISSWGLAKVHVKNLLEADVNNAGKLSYMAMPLKINEKTSNDGRVISIKDEAQLKNPEAKYISFKIKNNSTNRNHFKVVGPKPDGSKFGYGFPMMPFSTRKENWTIGTKVYKVNSLGFQKLIVTIKATDANKTVKLF